MTLLDSDATTLEFRHFHLFCGSGGGGIGFNRAHVRVGRYMGRMRCIGGIDVDPTAIGDFTRLVGVEGTVLDLFTREQFVAYHHKCTVPSKKGKPARRCGQCRNTGQPPAGWREATADDIRRAAHGERPHVIFLSAPCQGNSGMITDDLAETPRYQALNALALRAIELVLDAWADDPPELIILENVPRITQRSPELVADIKHVLEREDYVTHQSYHDCGQLGGLAQHRKRWLMVARYKPKVRPFLYEPPLLRVRGVGEVIGEMPLPNDARGGIMHRIPELKRITWERLALIPAGKDWQALARMDLAALRIVRWRGGVLGVCDWRKPAPVIKARSSVTTGRYAIADEQVADAARAKRYNNVFRIYRWDEPAGAVNSGSGPTSGNGAFADHRVLKMGDHNGKMHIIPFEAPSLTVTTSNRVGSGLLCVQDARIPTFTNLCRVESFEDPARTVTASQSPTNGAGSLSDARVQADDATWGGGRLGVLSMEQPATTRTAESHPTNGPNAVSDVRVQAQGNAYGIIDWEDPRGAVLNERAPGQGAGSVGDPRVSLNEAAEQEQTNDEASDEGFGGPNLLSSTTFRGKGKLRVTTMDEPAGTVIGRPDTSTGAYAVAEDRLSLETHRMEAGNYQALGVLSYSEPSHAVKTSSSEPGSGPHTVQDVRVRCKEDSDSYVTQGHYGVRGWADPARTVTAAGQHDNGAHNVSDERVAAQGENEQEDPNDWLISPNIPVIISLDNTWHRPFTALENAALQGYDWRELAQDPMSGSATCQREHVGNSVPPPSAEAIGIEMLRTLIMAYTGQTFRLSASPIWVHPLAVALSLPGDGVREIVG